MCTKALGSPQYGGMRIWEKALLPKGTLEENLRILNTTLCQFNEQSKMSHVKQIGFNDFLPDSSAPHKFYAQYNAGSMCKTRSMMAFGSHLVNNVLTAATPRDRHRKACFSRMAKILSFIWSGPTHPSCEEAGQFERDVHAFLAHYTTCNAIGRARGAKVYNITYKHHYLAHLGQDSHYMGPKLAGSCLMDEDFMGKMSDLTRGCLKGRSEIMLPDAIMNKYIRALRIRFQNADLFV